MQTKERLTPLRKSIDDILLDVSWAQISKNYFGKSRSWLNHKINGRDSNGGYAEISEKEKAKLKEALKDLARRIVIYADRI